MHLSIVHSKIFVTKGTQIILNEHNASQNEAITPFKCKLCDNSFSKKGHMKTHIELVHEKNKSFKCDNFDYSCSIKSGLTWHITTVHEKKKLFNCELCDKAFARK